MQQSNLIDMDNDTLTHMSSQVHNMHETQQQAPAPQAQGAPSTPLVNLGTISVPFAADNPFFNQIAALVGMHKLQTALQQEERKRAQEEAVFKSIQQQAQRAGYCVYKPIDGSNRDCPKKISPLCALPLCEQHEKSLSTKYNYLPSLQERYNHHCSLIELNVRGRKEVNEAKAKGYENSLKRKIAQQKRQAKHPRHAVVDEDEQDPDFIAEDDAPIVIQQVEQCPICQQDMDVPSDVLTPRCRHKLHRACADSYYIACQTNRTPYLCPVCRQQME
jgi:hypothetical protein